MHADFEKVYTEEYPHAIGYAVRRTSSMALAEELVQDAFLKVWVRMQQSGLDKPKHFLFRCLRNQVIDHYRMHSRRYSKDVAMDSPLTAHVTVGDSLRDEHHPADEQALVEDMKRAASVACTYYEREVFLGYYYHRESPQELSERFSTTRQSINIAVYRARNKIRRYLETGHTAKQNKVKRRRSVPSLA